MTVRCIIRSVLIRPVLAVNGLTGDIALLITLGIMVWVSYIGALTRKAIVGEPAMAAGDRVKPLIETIGERIKWARQCQPFPVTQAELAGMLRQTQGAIGHYERGIRTPPFATLLEIAAKLRVSTGYLECGDLRDVAPKVAEELLSRHPELGRRTTHKH